MPNANDRAKRDYVIPSSAASIDRFCWANLGMIGESMPKPRETTASDIIRMEKSLEMANASRILEPGLFFLAFSMSIP
jgi:hypothetical protein